MNQTNPSSPRQMGLNVDDWLRVRSGSLYFTGLMWLIVDPGVSSHLLYAITMSYDTSDWPVLMQLIEQLIINDLPIRQDIEDDNWTYSLSIFPSFDLAHPNDIWIEARNLRTGGLLGYDHFRFKSDRSQLLKGLFDSLDEVLKTENDKELWEEVLFDNEKYQDLKTQFFQNGSGS